VISTGLLLIRPGEFPEQRNLTEDDLDCVNRNKGSKVIHACSPRSSDRVSDNVFCHHLGMAYRLHRIANDPVAAPHECHEGEISGPSPRVVRRDIRIDRGSVVDGASVLTLAGGRRSLMGQDVGLHQSGPYVHLELVSK
jgi:hypothetical protein